MPAFPTGCTKVRLEVTDNNIKLFALCDDDEGNQQGSTLDLTQCVAFGQADAQIKAASGYHAPNWYLVKSNPKVKDVKLVEGDTKLQATCETSRGGIFASDEWVTSTLNLGDYVRNNNGDLEFIHPKHQGIPDWVHTLGDIGRKYGGSRDRVQKMLDKQAEMLREKGGEELREAQEKWYDGTYEEDGKVIRYGTAY